MNSESYPRRVKIDFPTVHRDAATELCAHHLQMATAFFECTDNDFEATRQEILRLLREADDTRTLAIANKFLVFLQEYYDNMGE